MDNTLTDVSMTSEPLSYSNISSYTFVGHSIKFTAESTKSIIVNSKVVNVRDVRNLDVDKSNRAVVDLASEAQDGGHK